MSRRLRVRHVFLALLALLVVAGVVSMVASMLTGESSECGNPPLVPATARTTGVTVLGSNAFVTTAGTLIDGEDRRLHLQAELHNGTGGLLRLGQAELRVYDRDGNHVATRFSSPVVMYLGPGETTVVQEEFPTFPYFFEGETNDFPDGWTSWELVLDAVPWTPTAYDRGAPLGTQLDSIKETPGGNLMARGSVVNTLDHPVVSVEWFVALYDADGRLVNVASTTAVFPEGIAPGASAGGLEVILRGATCYDVAESGAAGV